MTLRRLYQALLLCSVVIAVVVSSLAAQSSQSLVLVPREVLSVPWGGAPESVSYAAAEVGWQGPSALDVEDGKAFVVDRLNKRVQVYALGGSLVETIDLPCAAAVDPYDICVTGNGLAIAFRDGDDSTGVAIYRGQEWRVESLAQMIPGYRGWLHLEGISRGRLAIGRDIPPDENDRGLPHWAILDEAGALSETRGSDLCSSDESATTVALLLPNGDRQLFCPPGQQLARVNSTGSVVSQVLVDGGDQSNVITLYTDKTQRTFMRSRPLSENLDRWSTYLTVFGPNLEIEGRWLMTLPEQYREEFVYPSLDTGRTEVVADGKYYEMLYMVNRMVVLEWDPLGAE